MTLQRRDVLVYQDERYALDRDIMKSYFDANPGNKPKKIAFETNLHRGYFSAFEIIDKQLFVVDIRVNVDFDRSTNEIISKSVIESALADRRLCDWYTGELAMYSLSERPRFLQIHVKAGRVLKIEELTKEGYDDLGNHAYDYF